MSDEHHKDNIGEKLVHLDLKGAPLSISYLEKVLPLLKTWGVTGLLIEYEDTFPYEDDLKPLAAKHAYSKEDIRHMLKLAEEAEMTVIPLVQTFGHLEFVLKHKRFENMREIQKYPMALCPSNSDAVRLVCEMIDQVMVLHPKIQYFHIGCDEVYHLGICSACQERMEKESLSKEQLFFSHVQKVATHIKKNFLGVISIVWDDMFRFSEMPVILNCGLKDLVEPMVWHYLPKFLLPPDLWDNLSAVFPKVWVASAFKGATGPRATVTNIRYHLDNHSSWLETIRTLKTKFKSVQGIAITGWQRYDHYAVMCELFPHAIPSLGLCLRLIQQGSLSPADVADIASDLKFSASIPFNPFICPEMPVCNFPGAEIYRLAIEFVHAEAACNEFFALEGIAAWMNDYNVERKFINPIHVEPLLVRAQSLLQSLHGIEEKTETLFPEAFVKGVEEEWKGVFLSPLIKRMAAFVDTAHTLVTETPKVSLAST